MLAVSSTLMQNTLLHAFVKTVVHLCPGQSKEVKILLFPQELSMKILAFNRNKMFSGAQELHGCLRPATYRNMTSSQPSEHEHAKCMEKVYVLCNARQSMKVFVKILTIILGILLVNPPYSSAELAKESESIQQDQFTLDLPDEITVRYDKTGNNIVVIDGWRYLSKLGSLDSCHNELINYGKQMNNKEHIVTCLQTGRGVDNSLLLECMTNTIEILTFRCDKNGFLLGQGFGTSE